MPFASLTGPWFGKDRSEPHLSHEARHALPIYAIVSVLKWSSPDFTDTSKKPHTRQGGVSWSNGERTAKSLSRKPFN